MGMLLYLLPILFELSLSALGRSVGVNWNLGPGLIRGYNAVMAHGMGRVIGQTELFKRVECPSVRNRALVSVTNNWSFNKEPESNTFAI